MKIDNIEKAIVSSLLTFKDFSNVALSFTRPEYFENPSAKKIVTLILSYTHHYHMLPVKESVEIELDKDKTFTDDGYKNAMEFVKEVFSIKHDPEILNYMLTTCEEYYRKRAIFNVVMDGIQILDGKDKKRTVDALPEMFRDALGICFDTRVGHDYFEDALSRWSEEEETRVPFKHSIMNHITNGGIPNKTLTVVLATSGGGKSAFMSDWAAFLVQKGYDVVYFTMELSEKMVGQRIDANIFDMPLKKIAEIPGTFILDQVNILKKKNHGQLFIKEFPAGAASAADFRRVINELKLKKNFVPKIVFVDYLGICASARFKANETNSYGLVKAIAEELRGLGQEFDIPVISAHQMNRSAYDTKSAGKVGMDGIADSIGIAYTADLAISIYNNEELKEAGKCIVTQLKNRFGDPDSFKRFALGQDFSRMKFFDVQDDANDEAFKKYKNADDDLVNAASGAKLVFSQNMGTGFTFD